MRKAKAAAGKGSGAGAGGHGRTFASAPKEAPGPLLTPTAGTSCGAARALGTVKFSKKHGLTAEAVADGAWVVRGVLSLEEAATIERAADARGYQHATSRGPRFGEANRNHGRAGYADQPLANALWWGRAGGRGQHSTQVTRHTFYHHIKFYYVARNIENKYSYKVKTQEKAVLYAVGGHRVGRRHRRDGGFHRGKARGRTEPVAASVPVRSGRGVRRAL